MDIDKNKNDNNRVTALGYWSMLGTISSVCPLDCDFCFRKGTPGGLILDSSPRVKTVADVNRLCMEIKSGKRFDFLQDVGEYFFNANLISIIRNFRKHFPNELVDFTTSGVNLTRENVKELSKLGLIFLQVSLNSANPSVRKRVMGDKNPKVAIEGIKWLREYGIPFSGTIVGWPTIPEDDIRNTIHYLDSFDPVAIKINLPSYTRFFKGSVKFDTKNKWESLIKLVDEIRNKISTPITWEPYMCAGDPILPVITGVVKNSPAAYFGIRVNDSIKEVNGIKILFREQARRMLIQVNENDRCRQITLERNGKEIKIDLVDEYEWHEDRYPHKPVFHPREGKTFGLLIHQGLDVYGVMHLSKIIQQNGAKKVLFLSSTFLASTSAQLVEHLQDRLFNNINVTVMAPENRFFGGNIVIGDILVVSDYLNSIKIYTKNYGKPDLVVLPGSPFWNGYDLRGKHWKEIEKHARVPVKLLPTKRIMV